MSTSQPEPMTMEQFRIVVQRAGLELDQAELDHLLPMYQQLLGQLDALHDPLLELDLPAVSFDPEWN